LAVDAGNRLMPDLGIVLAATVIAVDANPEHLPAAQDLALADDGHIVLGLAGDLAGVAADATIEVDHHAPGVFPIEGRVRDEWQLMRVLVLVLAVQVLVERAEPRQLIDALIQVLEL